MEFEDDLNDEMEDAADVGVIFEGLEDPRVERKKLYPLPPTVSKDVFIQ